MHKIFNQSMPMNRTEIFSLVPLSHATSRAEEKLKMNRTLRGDGDGKMFSEKVVRCHDDVYTLRMVTYGYLMASAYS